MTHTETVPALPGPPPDASPPDLALHDFVLPDLTLADTDHPASPHDGAQRLRTRSAAWMIASLLFGFAVIAAQRFEFGLTSRTPRGSLTVSLLLIGSVLISLIGVGSGLRAAHDKSTGTIWRTGLLAALLLICELGVLALIGVFRYFVPDA